MINIVVWVGWFRVAAKSAGVRGRGQGSAGRPTAQRRGLDASTGRRILVVAGPPVWGGERAMLDPPMEVESASWSAAGELDWWVKERQEWSGRVRKPDGRQEWIKAADLRPAKESG